MGTNNSSNEVKIGKLKGDNTFEINYKNEKIAYIL